MMRGIRRVLRWGVVERGMGSRTGLTRRDFLRGAAGAAGAAVAGVAVGCAGRGDAAGKQVGKTRAKVGGSVVVVGGGFAGLACAEELERAGVNVVVLEAEKRVGGRVDTDRTLLPGGAVERGAHLIGLNHRTWLDLAQRYRVPLAEYLADEGESRILLGGKVYQGAEADALYESVDAAAAKLVELARPIDAERPWTSPDAAVLDAMSLGAWVDAQEYSAEAKLLLKTDAESDDGIPAERASLLAMLAMIKGGGLEKYFTDSEVLCCPLGNDLLAERLAGYLGQRVVRGAAVVEIDRARGLVSVADGRSYRADAVVLAIPPTRWGELGVTPELPAGLAPQMGANTKLMAVYDDPAPWNEAGMSSELVSDGAVGLTWIAARAARPARRGGAEAGGTSTALCLFSGGKHALGLSALAPKDRAAAALGSMDALLPGLSRKAVRTAFYDWPSDPRTRGSYTFPAPGQVTAQGPTLVDGLNSSGAGRVGQVGGTPVLFAGEHTSYAFPGYMEGALSSGVRAARKIISHVGSGSVPKG